MIFQSKWTTYHNAIKSLRRHTPLEKEDVMNQALKVTDEAALEMYYAPHNEFIHVEAKVVIVGITPGWKQTKTAYESALQSIARKQTRRQILHQAKVTAGFSGQMRRNLCAMLDEIGLAQILGLSNSSQLFSTHRELLHTTSIIRYPVFYQGNNYTGHTPRIERSPLLYHYAFDVFPEELKQLKNPAIIIPLGKAVDGVIKKLRHQPFLKKHTFILGFPHPSGANGHRRKQIDENKEDLNQIVQAFQKNN